MIYIVLPCYNLEDFPLDRPDYEIEDLLSCLTAAFDPEVLLLSDKLPGWISAYSPYQTPENDLVIIPACAQGYADYSWLEERRIAGCRVIDATADYTQMKQHTMENLAEIAIEKKDMLQGAAETETNYEYENPYQELEEGQGTEYAEYIENIDGSKNIENIETVGNTEASENAETVEMTDQNAPVEVSNAALQSTDVTPQKPDYIALFAGGFQASQAQERFRPEFHAVALGYFQSEAMTRRLQYMSCIDASFLFQCFTEAATAWLAGEFDAAKAGLQRAVDTIVQSKEYYLPTEYSLLDYIVINSVKQFESLDRILKTIDPDYTASAEEAFADGESAGTESAGTESAGIESAGIESAGIESAGIESAGPISCRDVSPGIFMTGRMLENLSNRQPETFSRLMKLSGSGEVTLVSGEYEESPLPMLPPEGVLDRMYDALYKFKSLTGRNLQLYGRLSFGLTPLLPSILSRLGVDGALHFTLDDGHVPQPGKSRMNWLGMDDYALPAIAQAPIDAGSRSALFSVPERIATRAENDYALSAMFVHKPQPMTELADGLFDLVGRGCRYGNLLGQFVGLKTYFNNSKYSGSDVYYSMDDYRSPFLDRHVRQKWIDPLSRWCRYYQTAALIGAVGTAESLATMLTRTEPKDSTADLFESLSQTILAPDCKTELVTDIQTELTARLTNAVKTLTVRSFAKADRPVLEEKLSEPLAETNEPQPEAQSWFVINPLTYSRTIAGVSVSGLGYGTAESLVSDAVSSADSSANNVSGGVKSGGSWFCRSGKSRLKSVPPMAEQTDTKTILRNEFIELTFDNATGGIRQAYDYHSHSNRFAQQLSFRLGSPTVAQRRDDTLDYSISTVDGIDTRCTDHFGEVTISGRLVDRDMNLLSGFRQTTTVYRGSRCILFDIELTPTVLPDERPWRSYYACRWAWSDIASTISRSVGLASDETEADEILSPSFVDVRTDKRSITILPNGLPWHRLLGDNRLDTLLIVSGEQSRRFRLGLAIDAPYPAHEAQNLYLRPFDKLLTVPIRSLLKPIQPSAVWADTGVKNVQITSCFMETQETGLTPENGGPEACGSSMVLVMRLQETEGRAATANLSFFKRAVSARINDLCGQEKKPLDIDTGRVVVKLHPYSWEEVRIVF